MPRNRFRSSEIGNQRTGRGLPFEERLSTVNPGAGITAGVGTIYKSSVVRKGQRIETVIEIDLTGLSSAAGGDILGTAGVCHIGYIDPAVCGTILGGTMRCQEAPVGGEADIDLYSATVGTGAYDAAITSLDEVAVTNAGTLSLGTTGHVIADSISATRPYLYLVSVGSTADAYTAGRIIITLDGVPA